MENGITRIAEMEMGGKVTVTQLCFSLVIVLGGCTSLAPCPSRLFLYTLYNTTRHDTGVAVIAISALGLFGISTGMAQSTCTHTHTHTEQVLFPKTGSSDLRKYTMHGPVPRPRPRPLV